MPGFGTVGLVATGVAINTIDNVRNDHDPFPTIMAGALFMGGCLAVGGLNPRLGTALAAVFLVGSFMYHGIGFFNMTTEIIGAKPAPPPHKPPEGN